ncbi:MAG: metallophosphoesterase [Candidatus Helarchaeota archaeon]|nr:metallophosphoesterase [Candidatus Helarchaeota archaeon]
MIRVACVSDVHTPKYLESFKDAIRKIQHERIDLFLFAGDMIYKGRVGGLLSIISIMEEFGFKFPIYSCFGNEEYDNLYEKLRDIGKNKIIFLEDDLVSIKRKGQTIGIIGTKGSLAKPTWWQAENIPNIKELYAKRIKKVKELAAALDTDIRILLFHYAPTYLTVVGEPKMAHPQMGTKAYEEIILNKIFKINAVFHGHAHRGNRFTLLKNRIPIYNVAFPLRKEITIVNIPRGPGRGSLLSYLK